MVGKRRAAENPTPRWLPWAILVAVLAAVAVGFLLSRGAATTESTNTTLEGDNSSLTEQRDATAEQALRAAVPVLALCDEDNPAGQALRADPGNPCGLAQQVRADPIPVAGPRGPGPTPQQIRAAVAAELAANPPEPGRAPTLEEITAAVNTVLTANPPEPGRPPTAAEISSAVASYLAVNPPRSGEPGRPPTAEEIQAAVDQFLIDNPPMQGVQGVGVQEVRAEQRGDTCVLVFVLFDPATTTSTEQTVTVADQVCSAGLLNLPEGGSGG